MRKLKEIKDAEDNLPVGKKSKFRGMTYEEGWSNALAWVLSGDSQFAPEDIEPPHHKDY